MGFTDRRAADTWAAAGLGEKAEGEAGSGCPGGRERGPTGAGSEWVFRRDFSGWRRLNGKKQELARWRIILAEGAQAPEEAWAFRHPQWLPRWELGAWAAGSRH